MALTADLIWCRRIGSEQPGIGTVGFGPDPDQLPIGLEAGGVDDLDRQSGAPQLDHEQFLVAAGRFDGDALGRWLGAQTRQERGDGIGSVCVLGATAPMPRRFEAPAANIDADEAIVGRKRGCHGLSCLGSRGRGRRQDRQTCVPH